MRVVVEHHDAAVHDALDRAFDLDRLHQLLACRPYDVGAVDIGPEPMSTADLRPTATDMRTNTDRSFNNDGRASSPAHF